MAALAELFDPHAHEPLTDRPWAAARAREAIATIVAGTERAFDPVALWPPHPLNEEDDELALGRVAGLYLGAAGVISALHALHRIGAAELEREWADVAETLLERYRREPDFPHLGVMPSLMIGEAGILLVAHTLRPSRRQEEQLLEIVCANVANPALELFWGSPGTMLAAQLIHERIGAPEWADAWNASADRLWEAWAGEVWEQDLLGRHGHVLGAAHGFAGNVFVLARGDLLDVGRRGELEQRTVAVLARHARRADGMAQWPPSIDPPRPCRSEAIRTQWCHGAPGIITSLASLAPHDDQLTGLLVAGGELTWRAGPLRKGPGLCHGTSGNGYAFLKLRERTGDDVWLHRARTFGMHAIEQVERTSSDYGRGRHTLWTGDLGVALYLSSCLTATADLPTLDTF